MVRILKDRQVRVHKGVVLYVNTDGTVRAELVLSPTIIDASSYVCVILLTEEEENGDKNGSRIG
ncbi:TPA: conserved hypothetical protein [Thermocrinis Great Boiling Spring virus]|nr:TPA: conserved hypothetical protein [Thermocrinis Great Boiling Spring virus]